MRGEPHRMIEKAMVNKNLQENRQDQECLLSVKSAVFGCLTQRIFFMELLFRIK